MITPNNKIIRSVVLGTLCRAKIWRQIDGQNVNSSPVSVAVTLISFSLGTL